MGLALDEKLAQLMMRALPLRSRKGETGRFTGDRSVNGRLKG